jgi:xanthine dehydrogenase accessory factor
MRIDVLQLAADLARSGEAFAMAVVVRREPASSAQVGNTALVTESGHFHGWLGGSCIQPTVVREAIAALADVTPRLISLSPDPNADHRPGVKVLPMTCHSGGSVDIYIEPLMPAPRLLVFGVSAAAQALARLGRAMGYAIDVVDPEADSATFPDADRVMTDLTADEVRSRPASQKCRLFAVVATLGQRDEEAVWSALGAEPAYLGVVASRRRFAQIRQTLLSRGASPALLDRITNPAGLKIGATAPEEVALSIMAQIVQVRHAAAGTNAEPPQPVTMEELDPVCGMTVVVAEARHMADYGGRPYYFCCGGCRERFLATPERYAVTVAS